MTEFTLPFGSTSLSFDLPPVFTTDYLTAEIGAPLENPEAEIQKALETPIGKVQRRSAADVQTIGIAINDKTRPVPDPNPLDLLLAYFDQLGFRKDQITLFIGSGTHKPMQRSELTRLMREEVVSQYRIVVHDCDRSPLADLGSTPRGTPIKLNADFIACDLKITVGNIEPHHFMGFSGGVKTAAIGLAGRETITTNHTMFTHPQAKSGIFNINPMRQEIEAIGRKAKIDFTLATILDENKHILKVFFGDPEAVMRAAIPVIQQTFGVRVPQAYDLVIASPGGAPKDINLYQAQKGLTHAAHITRDGGWVILLAACPEGAGSSSFEDYVRSADSHQAIIDHFNGGFFQVGPHKAFQIAREAVRVNIVLVSELPPQIVKTWKLTPSTPPLLQPLIDWIAARLPSDARVAVLPASARTMTEVRNE